MVALSLSTIDIMSDGSIRVKHPQIGQQPLPEPIGTRMRIGQRFIYVVHDDLTLGYARTLLEKIIIAITNEMFVPRRWYFRADVNEWRVDRYSKISFWPEELPADWEPYFFSGMTARQHGLFNQSGFGWRDSKANSFWAFLAKLFRRPSVMGVRPDGVAIYNFLLTGGTLLKKIGTWQKYTLFACQDTNHAPAWERYIEAPDRVFKQGVCGHNALKQSFYGSVNQHQGDLFLPNSCPGGIAAILTAETREIWPLPHETLLDGQPVTIVELCFRASEVLCKLDTGEWFYLLEQRTKNGNAADFVLHIPASDWVPVLPIPYVERQLA